MFSISKLLQQFLTQISTHFMYFTDINECDMDNSLCPVSNNVRCVDDTPSANNSQSRYHCECKSDAYEMIEPNRCIGRNTKASFTRAVNFIVFVNSTFDLFDGYFDNQKGCTTHVAHRSVRHHRRNVKL